MLGHLFGLIFEETNIKFEVKYIQGDDKENVLFLDSRVQAFEFNMHRFVDEYGLLVHKYKSKVIRLTDKCKINMKKCQMPT